MIHNDESEDFRRQFKQDIFPIDWDNPSSDQVYDLAIVGGGPGGMTAATLASSMGARVALIEKAHLGGECLSYGCIPSKALLGASRAVETIKRAHQFGVRMPSAWEIDFPEIMKRVYRLQATISPHDSAEHFKRLGVDVFLGEGKFKNTHEIQIQGVGIRYKKALIITGTQPIIPQIPGLEAISYFTNQNIFTLAQLPATLGVIGGGPIACELAQAFQRFGSKVILITHGGHLLPKDDPLATLRLQKVMEDEGVEVLTQSNVDKIEVEELKKKLHVGEKTYLVDELLIAVGRKPAIDLDLEKAQVAYDVKKGVSTNSYLQTTNPDIYSSGDVTLQYKFTHISRELARIAVKNALTGNQQSKEDLVVPWCTYTSPEIAHVGLNEQEAKEKWGEIVTSLVELNTVDRAILDEETEGFVKLIASKKTGKLVGATLVAAHAGEMISEITMAIHAENGLTLLSRAIRPFPTQAQSLRTAAEQLKKSLAE
ncbi:MAG: mercuric reductase [Parachlamydiaceae bacterium]